MQVKQELAEHEILPQKFEDKCVINDMPVNIKRYFQTKRCCQTMCLNNQRISSLQAVENERVFSSPSQHRAQT